MHGDLFLVVLMHVMLFYFFLFLRKILDLSTILYFNMV